MTIFKLLKSFCSFSFWLVFIVVSININNSIYTILNNFVKPIHKHKVLLLDNSLSEYEKDLVIEAALHWQQKTKNIISFDFKRIEESKDILYAKENSIVISSLTYDQNYYNIKKSKHLLAFFTVKTKVPSIMLIPERMMDEDDYRSVIIHELGHSIGLEHNNVDTSIMYAFQTELSPAYLTKDDIIHFCKSYYCVPKKL